MELYADTTPRITENFQSNLGGGGREASCEHGPSSGDDGVDGDSGLGSYEGFPFHLGNGIINGSENLENYVLAAMEIQKSQIESEPKQSSPEPTSTVTTSCGRKKSADASFVTNLRDRFHEFINTPMADHKTCLKTTIHKMMAVFPTINSGSKGGESSIPSQASVEN
ncbi:hypothetical protein Vadar_029390 [Vaccinium darrowii]|uniref:Uncharacterized protein n=1 Tax=Vaccinium darrowii TaxID=229202 RepID=A0ACB7YHB6_9ERIC|nr:hypothetical protein Vadar_029390 [Vaccinium darrowii]